MDYKHSMLALLESARQMEADLADRLSDGEREAGGVLKDWAFKEIVGHNSIYNERQRSNILAILNGQAPTNYDNYLELNDQDFEKFNLMTWGEIQAYSETVTGAYREMLETLSEADFLDTRFSQQWNSPLWQQMVGYFYTHPLLHYCEVYARRGDLDLANQLQEEAALALAQLDASERWQGVVSYNLACYYATSGQTQAAIQNLGKALELRPDLREWSREDSDLDSLRQEADYEALYH